MSKRERTLTEFVTFSIILVVEEGKVKQSEQHSAHTNTERELKGFAGFDFFYESGMTCMGGNELQVIYRGRPVLEVYWQPYGFDPKDCRVKHFAPDPHWQTAFRRMMSNKKRIILRQDSNRKKEGKLRRRQATLSQATAQLQEEAERLAI